MIRRASGSGGGPAHSPKKDADVPDGPDDPDDPDDPNPVVEDNRATVRKLCNLQCKNINHLKKNYELHYLFYLHPACY